MEQATTPRLEVGPEYQGIGRHAAARRGELLKQRRALGAEMPLRYWNQQAHFTTPASGTP